MNHELEDRLSKTPAAEHWGKVGVHHHHGFVVPLFSLRTNCSAGIGEYPDLKPLADWCASLGLDVIQLLPLNDTGLERSPYSAISAFALNPLHLGLEHLPAYDEDDELRGLLEELKGLNVSQRVQYNPVRALKERFLQRYYDRFGNDTLTIKAFHTFRAANSWLESYSLFKTLKEKHQWHSWEFWDDTSRHPTPEMYHTLLQENSDQVDYHCFVQYHCFKQLEEAKKHANQKGVFLKGDIPILISRESADVWFHHELFRIEMSAGSPPDMFASDGQNWGFSIYDWKEIQRQRYSWWRQRLQVASSLYDIYRIDHVVGFYRIWAVPPNMSGRDGEYIPSDFDQQMRLGQETMRTMLEASPLLPIGEDLGVVPSEVRHNLRYLGICGTKVMRWERMWDEDKRFIRPEDYIPESLTTVSTHDTEPLALWWENQSDEAREYCAYKGWEFTYELKSCNRFEIMQESHHTTSLFHINLLQEYLALIPDLTWPDLHDERINIPGKILDQNWTYRYKLRLEEMVHHKKLNEMIKSVLV